MLRILKWMEMTTFWLLRRRSAVCNVPYFPSGFWRFLEFIIEFLWQFLRSYTQKKDIFAAILGNSSKRRTFSSICVRTFLGQIGHFRIGPL